MTAEKLTTLPDGGGLTELGKLRMHARSLLEACDDCDLAKSIKDDDCIKSYSAYVDWLQRHDSGELYLQQLVRYVLYTAKKETLDSIATMVIQEMQRR